MAGNVSRSLSSLFNIGKSRIFVEFDTSIGRYRKDGIRLVGQIDADGMFPTFRSRHIYDETVRGSCRVLGSHLLHLRKSVRRSCLRVLDLL